MLPSGKTILTFLLAFFFLTVLGAVVDGSGGMASTRLNGALTAAIDIITVDSTDGFLAADSIHVDNEIITYTWHDGTHFGRVANPCGRGAGGTTAAIHADNAVAYNPESSILNSALGFNIVSLTSGGGTTGIISIGVNFVSKTLPKIALCDFSLYDHGAWLYLKILIQLAAAAFIILPLGIAALQAVLGAFASFFRSL